MRRMIGRGASKHNFTSDRNSGIQWPRGPMYAVVGIFGCPILSSQINPIE